MPLNITVYAAANFFAILLFDNFAAAPIKPNSIVRPNDAIKTSATTLDPQKKSSHHPVRASNFLKSYEEGGANKKMAPYVGHSV